MGLNQIKKQGGKGKGLAIAGIIISAAGMVIQVILVIALIVGGVSYTSKAIDEAKTDSFYSQSSSGNGDSSDKSKAQDNLDDALDDTLDETHDDLTDGDYGLYDSIQDFVDYSEFKDSIESEADTFADTGITFNYRVDGDTLVYEYVLDDSYTSLGDTVASSLDAMDSTYQSTANLLGSMCKTSSGKASLRVIMHTQSGQSLYDKTWLRDLQGIDPTWTRAKGFDTSCPLGPWIVMRDDLDWKDAKISFTLNGEDVPMASGTTANLIHGIPEQIAAISSFSTLLPGDVIMTGTPNASGHLDPGDETIVHVEGIGDLRNVIVRA